MKVKGKVWAQDINLGINKYTDDICPVKYVDLFLDKITKEVGVDVRKGPNTEAWSTSELKDQGDENELIIYNQKYIIIYKKKKKLFE